MMKIIKRNIGAVLFISLILGINSLLWIQRIQAGFLNFDVLQTSLLGSTLLMGFFMVFLLSTRMNWLVKLFGGLDRVYFWHRIMAIGTTALILVHAEFAVINATSFNTYIPLLGYAGSAGELARNGFFFLVAAALLAKYLKYEHFRFIHRLLIIPYFISLYHGFYSSWVNLLSFDALSIWTIATSLIGLGSSLYMIFVYQRTAFHHKGTVVSKTMLNDSVVELKVKMHKRYKFKAGQFAFIKIDSKGISKGPHPFSVSGQDGEYIFFTIKALGDFTKSLISTLETPAWIRVTRAFGHMTFKSKKKKQIWIAGGIGVTPFLSFVRSNQNIEKDIHMYYSVNYETEAVHLDLLRKLAKENDRFKFTLFEASKQGYLSSKDLDLDDDTTVYLCGPRPMVLSLEKQIKNENPYIGIEYEAFSFTGTLVDDILKSYKKIMKKLKFSSKKTSF